MILLVIGVLCSALGIAGIVLPVLPTTPFLLLAAFFFARSSPRAHRWLLNNRFFGAYLRNYLEGRGLSTRAKILIIVPLWATIGYSVLGLGLPLPAQVLLLVIAIAVSAHILSLHRRGPAGGDA